MTESPSSAESQWAEEERSYRAVKRTANRKFLWSFALVVFVLVATLTIATLLADFHR